MSDVSRFTTSAAEVLVVIDSGVTDFQLLAKSVINGATLLVLDPHRDGIQQITDAQQRYGSNILHIVSHGAPGCLYLGNTELSLGTLDRYTNQLKQWFETSQKAELILYGCNVAAGDAGSEFIAKLHHLTGSAIAASTSPTGHSALGGNWQLEITTGEMATVLAFGEEVEKWQGVLMPQIINPTGGVSPDGSDGLQIIIGDTGQYQVKYRNFDQIYDNSIELPANSPNNPLPDSNIFVAVGNTVVGTANPTEAPANLPTRLWKNDKPQSASGSGTSSDPFKVNTELYDDLNGNDVWDKDSEIHLTFSAIYSAPEKYFYQTYTLNIPTSNTQPIKLYHSIDTYLNNGDNGPAYALDNDGNPTTSASANTSLIGVIKGGGTPSESFEAFVELTPWDHWFSGNYNDPYPRIANGGDLVDTFDGDPDTDNGLAVQYNLGNATGKRVIENAFAFAPAPTAKLDSASDTGILGDSITNSKTPTISGKGLPPGSTVQVFAQGSTGAPFSLGFATVTGTICTFTPTSSLADDTYTITAKITSGGTVSNTFPFNLTIDSTCIAPTPTLAPTSDSGALDNITNDATPTILGTGAVAGDTIAVKAQLSGGSLITLGTAIVASDGTWSVTPTTGLLDGIYSITTVATDIAGNTSTPSSPLSVTIDTALSAPTVPDLTVLSDTGSSNSDNITSLTAPTFTGTGGTTGETVTLYADGRAVGTGIVVADGTWSVTSSALAEGDRIITAQYTDLAGNIGAASPALTVTIDSVAPASPAAAPNLIDSSDTGTSNIDNITSDNTPTFNGVAPLDTAIVELFAGTTSLGKVPVDASRNWSFTPTTVLADNIYSITVKAIDAAGNTRPASPPLSVTIDALPPKVTFTPIQTNDTTPALTGKIDDPNAVVEVKINGVTYPATNKGDGTWFIPDNTIAPLTDGGFDILVTAKDKQGNLSTDNGGSGTGSTTKAITIDKTAPTGAILTITPTPDGVNTVSIQFTEPVTNFDISDLQLTRNADGVDAPVSLAGAKLTSTDGGKTWALVNIAGITKLAGDYKLTLNRSDIKDLAGNGIAAGATSSFRLGKDCVFGTPLAVPKLGGKPGIKRNGNGSGNSLGGGKDKDEFKGLNGNDRLAGGGGSDRLDGGQGKDAIAGGTGRDILMGGAGKDNLKGGGGRDLLMGGGGKDLLVGGNGPDILTGGAKKDVLEGGKGKDMFVFSGLASEGNDLIKRFETQRDVIDLRPVFARAEFTGTTLDAKFHKYIQTVQVGTSTEVRVDLDGAGSGTVFGAIATLKNINASTISCSSFVVA